MAALLACQPAPAQVFHAEFSYREIIVSDYSSLFNSAEQGKVRHDTLVHSGIFTWQMANDSTVRSRVITHNYSNSMLHDGIPQTLDFLLHLDAFGRATRVSSPANSSPFPSLLTSWIGELNFSQPAAGTLTEQKIDGDFSIQYSIEPGTQITRLVKSSPKFRQTNRGRQSIVFGRYVHVSEYSQPRGILLSVKFGEEKKQVLGRKLLACIERELNFSRMNGGNPTAMKFDKAVEFSPPVELYPSLSFSERRKRLATTLLGQQDFLMLERRLEEIGSMTGEQQFRLKSMLRSLLIIDSSSRADFTRVLSTWKPGTTAFEAVENAVIESMTDFGREYISAQLYANAKNYERLKALVIKISVADAINSESAAVMKSLMEKTGDSDTRKMLALALSNYALTIRESLPKEYDRLTSLLLQPFRDDGMDSLQYLYIVGNAGIVGETPELLSMLRTVPHLEPEIMFAMRNIISPISDSLVENYLLHHPQGKKEYASLLAARMVNPEFTRRVQATVIEADRANDSTQVHALQYLLDNAWEENIDLSPLLAHEFRVDAYRREVADFRRLASLCDRRP